MNDPNPDIFFERRGKKRKLSEISDSEQNETRKKRKKSSTVEMEESMVCLKNSPDGSKQEDRREESPSGMTAEMEQNDICLGNSPIDSKQDDNQEEDPSSNTVNMEESLKNQNNQHEEVKAEAVYGSNASLDTLPSGLNQENTWEESLSSLSIDELLRFAREKLLRSLLQGRVYEMVAFREKPDQERLTEEKEYKRKTRQRQTTCLGKSFSINGNNKGSDVQTGTHSVSALERDIDIKFGKEYNQYRVIKKLGAGAFGSVWLSWDEKKKKYYALKVLRTSKTRGETEVHEASNMISFQNNEAYDDTNSNLLRFHDMFPINGFTDSYVGMIFDALGPSLFSIMYRYAIHGLPLSNVKCITIQILEGLRYLHEDCHTVHTDIKPENIMVTASERFLRKIAAKEGNIHLKATSDLPQDFIQACQSAPQQNEAGNFNYMNMNLDVNAEDFPCIVAGFPCDVKIKIGDFGNAVHRDFFNNQIISTREYRSLEAIMGMEFDYATDIWSVGCTVYEMLTGEYLFFPKGDTEKNKDLNHLALMNALLGYIPQRLVSQSRKYQILYEKDQLPVPKKPEISLYSLLKDYLDCSKIEITNATTFLIGMLEYDREHRLTARDALNDEWLNTNYESDNASTDWTIST